MAHTLRSLFAISCMLLLCGCLSEPTHEALAPAKDAMAQTLPPVPPTPYMMQVGDVLDIKLAMNPELNDQVTVRPDGMISTALARDVRAAGRTPAVLQEELTDRYKGQLLDPKIAVIVRSVAPTRIYVMGEVNNPGEFINTGANLTLLQALARAGGVKNSAGMDKIIIIRRNADDKAQAYAANAMSAVSGNMPANDVRLSPYDVVYVPRSDVGDAYLYFQQYVQQFVPVSFTSFYQINPTNNVK